MKIFFRILVLLFIIPGSAFSFNSAKCKRVGLDPRGGGWGTHLVFGLFNLSTSSGQYISSTGECSAMANLESRKKTFIADNIDNLLKDIAKGSGEYAFAYAKLGGCDSIGQVQFTKEMKSRFVKLRFDHSTETFYQLLEEPFHLESLKSNCSHGV